MPSPRLPVVAAIVGIAVFHPFDCRADNLLGENLGTIHFVSGGTPEAQAHVVHGVKLVHHMMYPEADREFRAALAADPSCAMAWWGRAMTLIHPLWPDAPSADDRQRGADYIRRGLGVPQVTDRERGYLETLDVYFGGNAPADYLSDLQALDRAWSQLAQRYPEDLDALALSALYHLAPARFLAKDKSHRIQFEAAARVEQVLARIPDHPGAQHYKIHALDFPLLADRALEVCDTYSSIAPDVPHALHMPTHIFIRRGLWEKSIEFNLRSAAAARALGENAGALNGHYPHALDYLAYAYLQRGQYREAEAIRDRLGALNGPYSAVQPTAMAFAFAAVPARCALERQAWTEAARLPLHQPATFPWGRPFLNCDSIVHFARGIGAARSGDRDGARAEIEALAEIERVFASAKSVSYWAAQAETQRLAVQAWLLFDPAKADDALVLMRRAAELEATADKEAVTPGEVLPAGDLLGDMLLEAGRPEAALAAFEAVQSASPNRLNTLYGAGLAAERSGDADKAQRFFAALASLASDGDAGMPRILHARAYLADQAGARSP